MVTISVRPRIGVTAKTGDRAEPYMIALTEAGADPVILANDLTRLLTDVETLDGMLFTGGADVNPARYGNVAHAETVVADADRDAYEIELAREAYVRALPMLGICRGLQVINVALGGTLVQHLPDVVDGDITHQVVDAAGTVAGHDVEIAPESRLARTIGSLRVPTNSRHHQAVAIAAPALRCVAQTPDGVPEAFEAVSDGRFLIGVQWHPESMLDIGESSRRLFRAFVESASTPNGRETPR